LPVREINLKACTPVILKHFILPGLGIEPRPGGLTTVSGSARTVPMSQGDKQYGDDVLWPMDGTE